jgi:acyl carrier protein
MSAEPAGDAIQARIVAFLRDEAHIDEGDLAVDTMLVRSGILDSMGLVQLATWMETAFDIEIPDDDIAAENLDSIEMMTAYVRARVAG